jgi:hypothetical protein
VWLVNRSGTAPVPDDIEVLGGDASDPAFTTAAGDPPCCWGSRAGAGGLAAGAPALAAERLRPVVLRVRAVAGGGDLQLAQEQPQLSAARAATTRWT